MELNKTEHTSSFSSKGLRRWSSYSAELFVLRILSFLKNKRPTWCHLPFYFTSYVLNRFRTLIYPSSGACDCAAQLPHWLFCFWFDVCWRFGAVISVLQASAYNSRKLLMMGILMSETCWAHKKWNKMASDIKLVFYSSNITMMPSPINIWFVPLVQYSYIFKYYNLIPVFDSSST